MKTDKTTIDISNESLEELFNKMPKWSTEDKDGTIFHNYTSFGQWARDCAKAGANWQAQKDKAIQDKLVYALRNIISMNGVGYKDAQKFSDDLQPLIKEAQELLNQLK